MEAMQSPWLDSLHAARSIRDFTEMQLIGQALEALPSFDIQLTDSLRFDLGDWRDPITWPAEIFTDIPARRAFYVERGFNTELTDFPEEAFDECLSRAGVTSEPPQLINFYGEPIARPVDDEEAGGLVRTNRAHDWLFRLETSLRKFIDEVMTETFGEDWPKHQLPNGVYDKWIEKKKAAEKDGGKPFPLIAYADFTEYEPLICRRDNWERVFVRFFKRQDSVRESFQRLRPIRLCTMHARAISLDDELLLYVETKRLSQAFLSTG